jgi:hypothetical protein
MRQMPKIWLIWATLPIFCFSLYSLPSLAQTNPLQLMVTEEGGKATSLKDLSVGKDLMVVLLVGSDCPLSQKALTEASADILKASPDGRVGILGLLIARDDDEDINRLKKEFQVTFPLYLDRDNLVAAKMGVKVVPTAILLNKDGKILYKGRINDRVEQLGKRSKARRHDLLEAIRDVLQGNPVRVAETEAVGCPVEIRKPTPDANGKVTYYRDIQPFLYKHCVVCHQDKGVAPFSLATYDDATLWMETAIKLIEQKMMPPGQAESDFAIENLIPNPSPIHMDLLRKWLAEGMPKGTLPAKPLELPSTDPEEGELGKPDMVLKQSGPMTLAATGDDLYRFLVFKLNLNHELKIRAIRLVPGNTKVVHHSLIFFGDSGSLSKSSSDKDLIDFGLLPGDKGPGYGQGPKLAKYLNPGNKSNQHQFEMIGGYAPGSGSYKVLKGYCETIPPNSDLLVQMHYHRTGKVETDLSTIELYFAKEETNPTMELRITNINDEGFLVMPPNQRKHTNFEWPVEEDCQIVSIAPHGHFLTLSQTITLVRPDGTRQTLVHVPLYDFNWQKLYTFLEPIPVAKGSKVHVSSLMDNTSGNPHNPHKPPQAIFMGENTTDEMVFPFMAITMNKNSQWNLQRAINSIYRNAHLLQFLRKGLGFESPDEKTFPEKNTNGKQP